MFYREISKIFREMSIELASRRPGGRVFSNAVLALRQKLEIRCGAKNFLRARVAVVLVPLPDQSIPFSDLHWCLHLLPRFETCRIGAFTCYIGAFTCRIGA